ncbi:MAG: antibiotic biosynthesis monooxygenase [Bacteroidetes bacterium]|nr:antibiotic biosynthesis monooxygenase [Bacteroidota bacterium]
MIIRIVKMTFQNDKVDEFKNIFEGSKHLIRNMKGCNHLELLQDINTPNIFFTYSFWNSEKDLNNYRNSEVFSNVWSNTKILFSAKPEAWSVEQLASL